MEVDNETLFNILQIILAIQIVINIIVLFEFKFSIKPGKIFIIFIILYIFTGFSIYFLNLYEPIPGGWCGSERFNPITIISIYGSFLSTFIYIISKAILKIKKLLRKKLMSNQQ